MRNGAKRDAPVAIIPAAGLGQRLMPVSSAIPKAMVPVAGQPLISLTVNQLARQGVRHFIIVVGQHGDQLRSYIERTYGGSSLSFSFVEQTVLDGPLGAVRLAQPLAGAGPQLIYLGDTLCRDVLAFDRDFVLAHPVDDQWRWCMAQPDASGALCRLLDKPATRTPAGLALIGVYYFEDGALLQRCIEDVYAAAERLHGEYQLSSAIERYNAVRSVEVRRAKDWFDCGSIDRYITARRSLIQSRHLNSVWVDDLGVLHKRSNGSDHLANEIRWYLTVPDAVQPLTPRIFSYSLAEDDTQVAMEYVPVPTLAEIYLYANVHTEVWEYALGRVLDLWSRVFLSETADDAASTEKSMEMYWKKTEARLAEATDVLPGTGTPLVLNGRDLPSWDEVRLRVRSAVERIARRARWSLIHGDLHFGNLLFDFNSGQLKMVDPRGAFGDVGCYGDARYDLAKLLHSFHGGYAHLAAGMFELKRDDAGYELRLYGGTDRPHLLACFRSWLERAGIDYDEILFIEGLLFLSLVPLHADDSDRQVAAYLTGLSLITEALERIETVARVR
jgi:dTDP-glucose pyrophosphorylase